MKKFLRYCKKAEVVRVLYFQYLCLVTKYDNLCSEFNHGQAVKVRSSPFIVKGEVGTFFVRKIKKGVKKWLKLL